MHRSPLRAGLRHLRVPTRRRGVTGRATQLALDEGEGGGGGGAGRLGVATTPTHAGELLGEMERGGEGEVSENVLMLARRVGSGKGWNEANRLKVKANIRVM